MTTLRRPHDPRVTIVSDTTDDINGVALGLRRLVDAGKRAGHDVRLVGPSSVASAMQAALPFYPGMTWSVPALPSMVDAMRGSDLVQLATPGPMGIAGLIAARMMCVPIIAQYHTEVAEYAARMTGLPFLRDLVNPLVGWFYQQADLCLAPSAAVVDRLVALGVPADRIQRVRRGVDLALFDPARRDRAALAARLGSDGPVALYVGRLSNEKNLDGLLAAWREVYAANPAARLVVVGEGPRAVSGPGVIATGPLHGEEIATMFASADVFAFASETETFGNVVVEAAASGLPAVVTTGGAAHEHVVEGVTGLVRDARDPAAFGGAILELFARRDAMTAAARAHALSYDLERAVAATWRIYRDMLRMRAVGVAS